MLSAVINFLFPAKCIGCSESGAYLCGQCLSKCEPARPPTEPWIASLFSYHDKLVKQAIWDIKYHGRFVAAHAFGEKLAEAVERLLRSSGVISDATITAQTESEPIIIVPIPASQSGKKKRGYNQAAIIARAMAEHVDFHAKIVENALIKVKVTERQATLKDRSVRLGNMQGAFAVNPKVAGLLCGRTVLLVDDVTTTGATLVDARRAMMEVGVKEVQAVTVGH
ncbi:MAG: hypothetical protein RL641_726 [Candidatus Parcubacteria bacterium]|jgi:ComF family protein